MALFNTPPNSLCILRLSAIGDVCHAISVVQAIQSHWPTTQITWITGKVEAQLIGDLPNINIVVFDKKQGFAGMRSVWRQLSNTRFDALLHMQAALRASVLSLGIKAKYKVGFSRNRSRELQWLFTNRHLPETQAFHVLDNFAEFARFVGVPFDTPTWEIPLSEKDLTFAQHAIPNKTLVISPAASKDERNWLPERYAEVADYAHQQGFNIALCGAPSKREIALGKAIESYCHAPLINLIGQTNLKQLTAILRQADIVLAPDSGPAHIANTQGTQVIGLYAHSNPERTGPYNNLHQVVSVYEKIMMRESKNTSGPLPWGKRAKGADIMSEISVSDVIHTLDKLIKG